MDFSERGGFPPEEAKTTPLGKIHLQQPGHLKRYKNIRNSKNITKVSPNENFIAYFVVYGQQEYFPYNLLKDSLS